MPTHTEEGMALRDTCQVVARKWYWCGSYDESVRYWPEFIRAADALIAQVERMRDAARKEMAEKRLEACNNEHSE